MKDLAKEIMAYSLQNAIEYGNADPVKVLPKLFQHGLDKKEVKEIMPVIQEAVKKINSMSEDERIKAFKAFEDVVVKREEKKKTLPEVDVKGLKKVVTRMAPEPSKYAHLGHALTFAINYLYAKKYKGRCLLRLEDTNPEKVSKEYADEIIDDVKDYLGIPLKKIKYVSDDMPKLYKYAEDLVKKGNAYVCFCKREDMQELRHKGMECQCRQFPVKIQIVKWKDFKEGKYKQGDAVLRFKGDMQNKNHVMRDPALFRLLDAKHYRHGTKYKAWPMYDFYNPIEDSIMGVTLILRSNEFDLRVELQDELKRLLKLKKQKIVQYGRFNVREFTTQGREIRELIESGELMGWDDPRLITLKALRKRGITKDAIFELAEQLGLSRYPVNLEFDMIAAINRKIIDKTSDRYSFISDPFEITLENSPGWKEIEVPLHPDREEKRKIKINDKVLISKKDFDALKGKEIRLTHLFNIELDNKSEITSIDNKKIPKINWISEGVKARILMPDGKFLEGIADSGIKKLKKDQMIQFERFGFCRFEGKKKDVLEFWYGHD